VDEYWFDGYNADGLNIDYVKIAQMIKDSQPDAVIYDSGMLVKHLPDRCLAWPGSHGGQPPDQNYRQKIEDTMRWYPNEPSIIFQGNWYHCGSPAISVQQMQDCYLTSTGHGITPLMNVPPNADSLIDEDTVAKLKELKPWVDKLNQDNLANAPGTKISDTGHRGKIAQFAADKSVDNDYETYFTTDDGTTTATIEVTFDKPQKIGGFILQEYIPLGQSVDGYSIECSVDGKWVEVFAGKKIGYKRVILEGRSSTPALRFNEGNIDVLEIKNEGNAKLQLPVADAVRLKIINAQACPLINNFQVVGAGQ
jgi:alpha-L-fucosidase